jgi:hypothetical protein
MPTAMSGMVPLGSTVPPLPELKTTVAVGMRMAKGMYLVEKVVVAIV